MNLIEKEHNMNTSILIVDDNPQNLQVLGRLLQECHYDIEFATNGVAALDWLDSRIFDLVLLDINMPEIDGFEVCRKIRKEQKLNNLPIIFLSADNDRESILRGFELGGQDYITKPFDSRELMVRVKTHISLKESRENLEILNRSLEEKVKERTVQLREANEALETMNEKLTELDRAKSDFLNLISHEIRTPLNGILLPLELLKDVSSHPDIKEMIEVLDSSVKRLEKFALDALLITRLKVKPYEILRRDIDLGKVVNTILEELKAAINEKNISVKPSLADLNHSMSGETELIQKCLFNIMENAIRYSPAKGTIELMSSLDGEYIQLIVADSGKGIPAEIVEKGTEPFAGSSMHIDKSTGTGLPLARMIMEAHRGSLILGNRASGSGAIVKLRFRTKE
jgi:two-component system, sensor histidine kinase and response regulator